MSDKKQFTGNVREVLLETSINLGRDNTSIERIIEGKQKVQGNPKANPKDTQSTTPRT